MTKALLATFVLAGSAFFVGCAAEEASVPANGRTSDDAPAASSDDDGKAPTNAKNDQETTTAPTTDRAAPTTTTTTTTDTKTVPPGQVVVKPIDPVKPVAPVIPAFACKTDTDSVTASYKIALLRAPDQDGLSYWVLQVQSGQERIEVLRNMVRSDEFVKARSVLSDEQFVNSLYTGFLARKPDDDGKAYWLNDLTNGVSRTDVAIGFINSGEFADPSTNGQASCYF